MGRKRLDQCRSRSDFIRYAERNGGCVKEGGSHTKIYGPDGGLVTVPRHNGDLATGTRRSIIKMIKLIGLAIIVLWLLTMAF